MVPLAAGSGQCECPLPTEGGEEKGAAFRGPRLGPVIGTTGADLSAVSILSAERQRRSATGASENAVIR
jgi:hypothetical protein